MRRPWIRVVISLAVAGCSAGRDELASDVAPVSEATSPSFATDIVKAGELPAGTLDGILAFTGFERRDSVSLVPQVVSWRRFVPIHLTAWPDYSASGYLPVRFMDLERRALVETDMELPFWNLSPSWDRSGDEGWLMFEPKNPATGQAFEVAQPIIASTIADARVAASLPEENAEGDSWYSPRWVGRNTLSLKIARAGGGGEVGVDPATFVERWRVSSNDYYGRIASPDDKHVLLYHQGAATLVTLQDGAPPILTNVEGWGTLPATLCASPSPIWPGDEALTVTPSPTSKSFLVTRIGDGFRQVATVAMDGKLTLHEACARRVSNYATDGRIAYELNPAKDATPRVVVHRENAASDGDVVITGLPIEFGFNREPGPLQFTSDGNWVETHRPYSISSTLRVLGFANAATGGPARVDFVGDALAPGEDAEWTITPAHDKAALVVATGSAARIEVVDLTTKVHRPIVPRTQPDHHLSIAMISDGVDSTLLVEETYPGDAAFTSRSNWFLVALDGTVKKAFSTGFYYPLGWAGDVLYYVARPDGSSKIHQLRGISRDGQVDVAIGPPSDDIAVKRSVLPYDDTRGRVVVIEHVLLQVDNAIYSFKPGTYVPSNATPRDVPNAPNGQTASPQQQPEGDGPRVVSDTRRSTVRSAASSCATSAPGAPSSSLVLALAASLALLRRRSRQER